MKRFIKLAAQGDILVEAVDSIPANVVPGKIASGKFIVAHSETGHHHVIDRVRAEVYEVADDQFCAYIRTLGDGAEIVHERDFDTHETLFLEPNQTYRIWRQVEPSDADDGWRSAAD